jgi:hypothetical protein
MPKIKNIAAYTASNGSMYPEYISINERAKKVSITVRSEESKTERGNVIPGEMASIVMSLDAFATFVLQTADFMARYVPEDPNQNKLDV